jgi:cytochrome o ubiquinol oxidase subunit 2
MGALVHPTLAHLALAHRAQRAAIALGAAALTSGCDFRNAPVLDPKGPIALAERDLLFTALALMLIVVIPVFVMAFLFAWRYRASNTSARYTPDWAYSGRIDAVIWLVPALIVASLGALLWRSTHRLDPYRAIDPVIAPLEVQVVAQDWKWLFIYPAQGIASVNQLVFPSAAPLSLKITSDTVMNSFYVPALGGQIYAMAGMETRLNLKADATGRFAGRNAQYSGAGFSDQHFQVVAASAADFEAWLAKVRQAPEKLDGATYRALAMPTRGHPVTYYSAVEPNLFGAIIAKYAHGHDQGNAHAAPESTNAR